MKTELKDCPACGEDHGVIYHEGIKEVYCIACSWSGEPLQEDMRTGESFNFQEWLNEE